MMCYYGAKGATTYLQWVLLLLVVVLHSSVVKCCLEEERLALLEIKAYMLSYLVPEYNSSDYVESWSFESSGEQDDCCKWSEVRCSAFTGRVIELVLNGKVMRYDDLAMRKPWLFNLTLFRPFSHLVSLDLSTNDINGLVDDNEISTLKNLQVLKLDYNYIFGTGFISTVGDLTSLRKLSLSDAIFNESSFPLLYQELANLRELQVLNLSYNYISGNIQGFCELKSLLKLDLSYNLFSGDLRLSCLQNLSTLRILDLSHNQFSGKFPKMLKSFEDLEYLDLSHNYFEGKLSLTSLANLSKLNVLRLSGNNLRVRIGTSSIRPTFQLQTLVLRNCNMNKSFETFREFLSHQTNLTNLDLSSNNLFGVFPTWLFINNSKLKLLYLLNNSLSGSLQFPHFTNLSLENLDVSNNNFHGKLPKNFGLVFPRLTHLNMSWNHFEGLIPNSIGQIKDLGYIDLSNNNFSGELPRKLISDCKSLDKLVLSNNNLEGDIIPEDKNLPRLRWMKLNNNRFEGTINEALRKSFRLFHLDISNNNVTGQLPWWIGNFFYLDTLSVSQNKLNGQIPKEICAVGHHYLDLSRNNFSGTIPSCSNSCQFFYMQLHNNNLIGEIPDSLSNCSRLQTLDLRDNHISGSIPLWIDKLSSLIVLLLGGNNLHGTIPKQLCKLRSINILDLSRNNLYGEIPKCFNNISFGMKTLMDFEYAYYVYHGNDGYYLERYNVLEEVEFLAKNQYLSYMGKDLVLMSGLDLSSNELSGDIPPQLGELQHIHSLNLSHNILSGSIPNHFSNLQQVESLDLSFNNLSGGIPSQLVELNALEIFNVSYNNLSGKVPVTGQFGSFDERNYLGNPGLFGFPGSDLHNQTQALLPSTTDLIKDGGDGDHDRTFVVDFLWSFGMSCATIFIATVAILYINPQWRQACFDFVDWYLLWWLPISWRLLY